jgi:hypothetical protein
MRFISTRTHGVLDYVVGALLIVVPYILGFADGTAAQWVPQLLGLVAIGGALLTDYELGVMRVIPMPVHLNHVQFDRRSLRGRASHLRGR